MRRNAKKHNAMQRNARGVEGSLQEGSLWGAQGKLVNETRCMQCETVTSREEAFYDLSLEIDQNSSITSCLRQFRCPHFLSLPSRRPLPRLQEKR